MVYGCAVVVVFYVVLLLIVVLSGCFVVFDWSCVHVCFCGFVIACVVLVVSCVA